MKQFDPPKNTVKVSPHLPSTPSNHSSLPSNVLYLQGIHNTCSKHKIIQYLRNHNFNGDHCDLLNTHHITYPFFNYLSTLIYAGIKNTAPVEFLKFCPHLCKVTLGLAQIILKFLFLFLLLFFTHENTSVSLSRFPGDICSVPDTMLSSFTSTRPSRLEVYLSLFLVF